MRRPHYFLQEINKRAYSRENRGEKGGGEQEERGEKRRGAERSGGGGERRREDERRGVDANRRSEIQSGERK